MIMIKVDGIGKVKNNLTNYHRKAEGFGRNFPYTFTKRLANELRKAAEPHKNTGYLSSERGIHNVKIQDKTWGVSVPYYMKYLERGTGPAIGEPSYWIPRMGKTIMWARKHNMSFWLFQHIVAKYGTRPHPFSAGVITRELSRVKDMANEKLRKDLFG